MKKFIPANPSEFRPLDIPRQLTQSELRAIATRWRPLRLVQSLPAPDAVARALGGLVVFLVVLV